MLQKGARQKRDGQSCFIKNSAPYSRSLAQTSCNIVFKIRLYVNRWIRLKTPMTVYMADVYVCLCASSLLSCKARRTQKKTGKRKYRRQNGTKLNDLLLMMMVIRRMIRCIMYNGKRMLQGKQKPHCDDGDDIRNK